MHLLGEEGEPRLERQKPDELRLRDRGLSTPRGVDPLDDAGLDVIALGSPDLGQELLHQAQKLARGDRCPVDGGLLEEGLGSGLGLGLGSGLGLGLGLG